MESPAGAINETELMDRIGGDATLLGRILSLYRETVPKMRRELENALNAGDPKAVWHTGHSLKGVMGNLAAPRATDLAHQIEIAGSAGNLVAMERLTRALDQELLQVRVAMANFWHRVAPGKPFPLD